MLHYSCSVWSNSHRVQGRKLLLSSTVCGFSLSVCLAVRFYFEGLLKDCCITFNQLPVIFHTEGKNNSNIEHSKTTDRRICHLANSTSCQHLCRYTPNSTNSHNNHRVTTDILCIETNGNFHDEIRKSYYLVL